MDPFTGKQFTLSGPAFGDKVMASLLTGSEIDEGLVEESVPMVTNGMQLVPSSSNHFKKGGQPAVYVEVYNPLLTAGDLRMGILFDIVSQTTNKKVYSSSTLLINGFTHPGIPLVPVIFPLPIEDLPAGSYAVEIWARDSAQNVTPVRTGDFSIE